MPQRLIAKEPRVCTYESYEDIPLKVNEVRVQTEYASPKHGSELPAFRGDSPHLNENYDKEWTAFLPKALDSAGFSAHIPGNQFVGIVTVVPFLQSAAAYERYVDRHPEESVKMGVVFTQEGDR
jgi:hypothetical protein